MIAAPGNYVIVDKGQIADTRLTPIEVSRRSEGALPYVTAAKISTSAVVRIRWTDSATATGARPCPVSTTDMVTSWSAGSARQAATSAAPSRFRPSC